MSVPPLFKFPKNSFFSIGLPRAENTFYQIQEKELKKQLKHSKVNEKEIEKRLPAHYIVGNIDRENSFNSSESQVLKEKYFDALYQKMIAHLDHKPIWIRDTNLVFSNNPIFKTRHISEDPKDDLFILKTFSSLSKEELENFEPEWYFINTPYFFANPEEDGINHSNFTIINFVKKVVLIGGASYSQKLVQQLLSDVELALNIEVKNNFKKLT